MCRETGFLCRHAELYTLGPSCHWTTRTRITNSGIYTVDGNFVGMHRCYLENAGKYELSCNCYLLIIIIAIHLR